jgi:hypothetical protein
MSGTVFPRLRVLRDLPAQQNANGYESAPPVPAGTIVHLYYDPDVRLYPPNRAVTLEPGGPWFAVPADAVEEV